MSWWDTVRGWFGSTPPPEPSTSPAKPSGTLEPARWLAADNNRFGVPVLDLHAVLSDVTSYTRDPAMAECAVSWGGRTGADVHTAIQPVLERDCDLSFPAARDLPDGLLFTPRAMEDKWALAWRDGQVLVIRSWTAEVHAIARATHADGRVHLHHLAVAEGPLAQYGDPVQVVDWLVRTHALGEAQPLPVHRETAEVIAAQPAVAFGAFGRKAMAAACVWQPEPPKRPLRSDGAVSLAVRQEDVARLEALAAEGLSLESPGTHGGFTPLHIAATKGHLPLVDTLLRLGAAPDPTTDTGATPLVVGIVHHAPPEVFDRLVAAGADPTVRNADGFGTLHAAAEVGRTDLLDRILDCGIGLEARTGRMQTALHIAAGLGHTAMAKALLDAGADAEARSPWGTPAEIAHNEGHSEVVALFSG